MLSMDFSISSCPFSPNMRSSMIALINTTPTNLKLFRTKKCRNNDVHSLTFLLHVQFKNSCKNGKKMMEKSGLVNIKFSNTPPYWVAVGIKK